jgi:hypothetical protein
MLGPTPVTYTSYQLTCCTKADIDQTWQPGTEVDLHLMVETRTQTTISATHEVVIVATLMGPFSDVPTLKHAKGATHVIQGSVVTMDDRTPPVETPVSIFLLPADLPAGFYNLALKSDFGGGNSMETGSIVHVGTP